MIADLLPLIIGAAVLPAWIIIALLLLRGEGGVMKAAGFAAGAMAVRTLQIILFGFVIGSAADKTDPQSSNYIGATLMMVVGILLLVTAFKKWRKEEDPDAPAPKWMSAINGLSPLKALGMGALLMTLAVKQWVFTLSAIAVVEEAQLSQLNAVLAYVFFVLATMSLIITPIILSVVAPKQSAQLLDTAMNWLERNNRVIMIAASLIFGIWFLFKGISGLLG